MSVKPEIELTADGSHTLFVPHLNEHYHSVNGAVQESMHVFINEGLYHCRQGTVSIFEVGFGTGLNAFLTLLESEKLGKTIHYTSIEAYPLALDIVQKLNYKDLSDTKADLYNKIHEAEWGNEIQITPTFFLTKIKSDFTSFDFASYQNNFDLIYFDAFAPDKQPSMWSQELFDNLYNISKNGAILTTYCAKGIVRRTMQQSGYQTERLPGPPGKREMLRATKKGKENDA